MHTRELSDCFEEAQRRSEHIHFLGCVDGGTLRSTIMVCLSR